MDFSILLNKKIAILWYGKEWKSTLNFLLRHNVASTDITVLDGKNINDLPEWVNCVSWENYLKNLADFDLIFKSAWIPYYPEIQAVQEKTFTQVQFFFDHYEWKVIALTASKWKTTMTSLTNHLLQTAWYDTKLVWNIWTAVLDEIDFETKHDFVVIELSSFMLETLKKKNFCSILWAIFPVHLDWHGNMENYTRAKFNIINWSEHTIVYEKTLNDYDLKNKFSEKDLIKYGKSSEYTWNDEYFMSKWIEVFPLSDINLIWEHNLQNISAIVALANLLWISDEVLHKAIQTFEAVRHRLQLVWNFKWIDFYDDAIATTPDSTMAAMNAIWDRLETIFLGWIEWFWFDFPTLVERVKNSNVKNIVFFPDSWEKIAEMLWEEWYNTLHTRDMKEAVKFAYDYTSKWKVCLLSTASPSFSCWKNFEEKWDLFQQYVLEMWKE